jgi:hypothetical protein
MEKRIEDAPVLLSSFKRWIKKNHPEEARRQPAHTAPDVAFYR